MKFEHVLQIYWSNYFLFNGRTNPFDTSIKHFFTNVGGFNNFFKKTFIKRFELTLIKKYPKTLFSFYHKDILRSLNVLLSQISSVNNQTLDLVRVNLVRLYLIKTYRGRAQAFGKPSRGQRTWSNAWTAYNSNRVIRNFIAGVQKIMRKDAKDEKIDYKRLKKKFKKKITNSVSAKKAKKLVTIWF